MLSIELGLTLFILGFILIFIGIILSIFTKIAAGEAKVEGGGVVLIGPVPIAFGTSGKWVVIALVLALALMVVYIIFGRWII
ncbi:MAG: DUF131 domain-containing protein [Nitrososphaeria archaeon]|nr:DUF131 domain-containing protein [Nitrososphaeria archaeon]